MDGTYPPVPALSTPLHCAQENLSSYYPLIQIFTLSELTSIRIRRCPVSPVAKAFARGRKGWALSARWWDELYCTCSLKSTCYDSFVHSVLTWGESATLAIVGWPTHPTTCFQKKLLSHSSYYCNNLHNLINSHSTELETFSQKIKSCLPPSKLMIHH